MNSKRKLQLLERDIGYMEKTLVNDYVSLKSKMLLTKKEKEVTREYQEVEEIIKSMIPQSAQYIDTLTYWNIGIDDIDDPIDFSEC
ncbi:hypothetical protein [Billgrantia endophytica]|uniref:Uncharacterized protein n=1 Tax=Billgrantia endophytica TaxID=2033802 RepID=A0A2N7TUF6_9GAMM|nr:hypothetical protein [Halomonas endophytica]PMR71813.1 hypothetical protein C1H69_23040 [Halomonas endophytica]